MNLRGGEFMGGVGGARGQHRNDRNKVLIYETLEKQQKF